MARSRGYGGASAVVPATMVPCPWPTGSTRSARSATPSGWPPTSSSPGRRCGLPAAGSWPGGCRLRPSSRDDRAHDADRVPERRGRRRRLREPRLPGGPGRARGRCGPGPPHHRGPAHVGRAPHPGRESASCGPWRGCCVTVRCWRAWRWPSSRRARSRGLLGRDGVDGALLLRPCRSVHTVGMRFPIDVAFCDDELRVLRVVTMPRHRLSRLGVAVAGGDRGRGGRVRPLGTAPRRPARGQGVTTAGTLVLVGHADREPRRPGPPGGRGAGRRRRRVLRGHPPHRQAAVAGRHRAAPVRRRERAHRGPRDPAPAGPAGPGRAGGGGVRRRDAGRVRSRRAPRRRGGGRGAPRRGGARPVGRAGRPRGQRAAGRAVRVRGVPAPQGGGPCRAPGRGGAPSPARRWCTRRPTGSPARWPTSSTPAGPTAASPWPAS